MPEGETVIKKYLANHQERDFKELCVQNLTDYHHVMVIPAFKEGASFVDNLRDFSKTVDRRALIIIVVNEPHKASAEASGLNRRLIETLMELGANQDIKDGAHLIKMGVLDILALGPLAIEKRMGVGLARKIGADLALRLIDEGRVQCPIIYSTDADAKLPKCYFIHAEMAQALHPESAAYIYPFKHTHTREQRHQIAIDLYEQRLHQYVSGLTLAGSPYAFHTIGSTIAVNARAYAMVRGFPKIAAGEDFYLLNKLRKVGYVRSLAAPSISLSARISSRVPFGTGPALFRILQFENPYLAPIFYHPQVFYHLRWFLRQSFLLLFRGLYAIGDNLRPDEENVDHDLIRRGLMSINGKGGLELTLAMRKSKFDRIKAFHDWFDGFKTLKFIHFLRDERFPMQSFSDHMNGTVTATQDARLQL